MIASHIKPWSASTNEERLDVNNGLLLCPNHDALFNKQLISFNMWGKIGISKTLDETACILMNVNDELRVELYGRSSSKFDLMKVIKYNEDR